MVAWRASSVAVALAVAVAATHVLGAAGGRVNVVLLGATGNLAEKYLWQGFFNIFADGLRGAGAGDQVFVYPAATKDVASSAPILARILRDNITVSAARKAAAPGALGAFLARVAPYTQLKTDADYAALGRRIAAETLASGEHESGRLLYLSVPPKFFGSIAESVNAHLRPAGWLRVIVEKPFGVDLASAQALAAGLYRSLKQDEILLVDHYMGKEIMAGARQFLRANPEALRGADRPLSVEVGMLERDDCKGRTGFYDEVGVLRDTMQNHLMMMLALVAMDVEAVRAGTPEPEARRRVFEGLSRARLARSELKQYRAYNEHVNADRAKWGDKPLDNPSRTPTYARVDFSLDYPASPLHGVPIVFKSGKALDVRHSYINVHFTSGALLHFHMQGPHKESGLADEPMVFRSAQQGRCFETEPKSGWRCKSLEGGRGFVSLAPSKTNAYEVLLRAGLEGEAENFVRLDEVLESWKVWTPLLDDMAAAGDDLELELYDHGYGDHYLSHGRGAAPRQDKTEL